MENFDNIIETYRSEEPNSGALHRSRKRFKRYGFKSGTRGSSSSCRWIRNSFHENGKSKLECASTGEILPEHENVGATYYPGLPVHPQHTRARKLFKNFGAIFSIDLVDGIDCFEVLDKMEIIISSSNLGDTRTLAIPVAHTIFYEMGSDRRKSMGISDSMIRFSVGIEESEITADLKKALE